MNRAKSPAIARIGILPGVRLSPAVIGFSTGAGRLFSQFKYQNASLAAHYWRSPQISWTIKGLVTAPVNTQGRASRSLRVLGVAAKAEGSPFGSRQGARPAGGSKDGLPVSIRMFQHGGSLERDCPSIAARPKPP